jgi:hypothetical protein
LENHKSPDELDSDSDLEDGSDQMDADDDGHESWDVNDSDMDGLDTDFEVQSLSNVCFMSTDLWIDLARAPKKMRIMVHSGVNLSLKTPVTQK